MSCYECQLKNYCLTIKHLKSGYFITYSFTSKARYTNLWEHLIKTVCEVENNVSIFYYEAFKWLTQNINLLKRASVLKASTLNFPGTSFFCYKFYRT
jgi:hypothetical protein